MPAARHLFSYALIVGLLACPGLARAQGSSPVTEGQIQALIKEASTAIEAYSYSKAEEKLEQALTLAADAGLKKSPAVTQVYVMLGIVAIAGSNDLYRGLHHLVRALRLDAKATVPNQLATPQLLEMMKTARQTIKAVGRPPRVRLAQADKGEVKIEKQPAAGTRGLVHVPIESAKRGIPIPVKAQTGSDIQAHKMRLFYRSAGTVKFDSVPMKKSAGAFRGAIPASASKGRYIHYYIEAQDKRGRMAASFGGARSPTVIIINN